MSIFMNSYIDGTNITPNNLIELSLKVNAFKHEIKDGILILYIDVNKEEKKS